eukprot:COSAG04_NODE_17515_length_467_cov_0.850543_1_plen_82_part_00
MSERKQFSDAESAEQLRYKDELLALSAKLQGKRPADDSEASEDARNPVGDKAAAAAAPTRKRSKRQPVPSARKLAAERDAG